MRGVPWRATGYQACPFHRLGLGRGHIERWSKAKDRRTCSSSSVFRTLGLAPIGDRTSVTACSFDAAAATADDESGAAGAANWHGPPAATLVAEDRRKQAILIPDIYLRCR